MSYEELIAEKNRLSCEQREITEKIEEIDKKIKLAINDKAHGIFEEIVSKLDELSDLGYTITAMCNSYDEGVHYHEYGMSLEKIELCLAG